jgi:hypothetical protein
VGDFSVASQKYYEASETMMDMVEHQQWPPGEGLLLNIPFPRPIYPTNRLSDVPRVVRGASEPVVFDMRVSEPVLWCRWCWWQAVCDGRKLTRGCCSSLFACAYPRQVGDRR